MVRLNLIFAGAFAQIGYRAHVLGLANLCRVTQVAPLTAELSLGRGPDLGRDEICLVLVEQVATV